ncbi:uncharacterized protein EV420DRAFT_1508988 [Desarmillaria tabescens]|uniref:Xylanolytic transcriptional activator regulatory domain-containing protein n=1 Tax=Armillaria tabescens TaxID=1929756 RepID=A0AA39U2W9_ARMTA|nr:uncharacterized protein EV420DRAFT_1508988 [Desarmillaria tabescens]KAK0465960.1 hypothetical protein EV420DRAFT_1508988 [Desarmillaria tabescens]
MPKEPEKKPRRKPGRVPCEKCVSRGCGSICPDGSLTSGKGNRMLLKILQSTVSSEPHPLLRTDLLQLKSPQSTLPTQNGSAGPSTTNGPTPTSANPQSIPWDSLQSLSKSEATMKISSMRLVSTLTIGGHGESSFLGKTARSEALSKPQSTSTLVLPRVSKRIIESNCADPLDESLGHEIFSLLPPLSEAVRLCEVYLEHGKYLYSTVDRTELFDEVLSCIYRAECVSCHHTLYFLFSVFALAVLFDQERPAYSVEAQEYYYLARAAIGLSSINNHQTLRAIQGMIHLTEYETYSDWEALGTNSEWITMGCAVQLGQSLTLRLQILTAPAGSLGKLPVSVEVRIFWQLFACDTWTSFLFGRPPSMSAQYIDCALPKDTEEIINADGERETGFHSWMWQYATLMHSVMGAAFGVKVPAYAVILDLDRKIRDFPVPLRFRPCTNYGSKVLRPEHYMQRWMVLMSKESVLLNLHRTSRTDLARHRYLPSVMATYRSAWRIMQSLKMLRTYAPLLSNRVNLAWSHALSAAIVMCILVTRAPNSTMTKPSLQELDLVAQLFEEAAPNCRAAANTLVRLYFLEMRFLLSCCRTRSKCCGNKAHEAAIYPPDELDRLGGKTHLISSIRFRYAHRCIYPIASATLPAIVPEVLSTEVPFSGGDGFGFFAQQSPSLGEFGGVPPTQPPQPAPYHSAFGFAAAAAPMLDATWQSFC